MQQMPIDAAVHASDPLGFGVPLLLSRDSLRYADDTIPLLAVTHVRPVVTPARLETRRWVEIGSAALALFAGLAASATGVSPSGSLMTGLVVVLAGVLASDWLEARFPTPGVYAVDIEVAMRRIRIGGLRSPEAAQALHERIAAAVRTAQGLNG